MAKSTFGNVRKHGRGFQARYTDPATKKLIAVGVFPTRADAQAALARVKVALDAGTHVDPRRSKAKFGGYADRWLADPPRSHTPKTRESYAGIYRVHIAPTFANVELGKITPESVRQWHGSLVRADVGRPTIAKAYRVLHAILATACDDDILVKNPCRLKGAGQDDSPERPLLDAGQVLDLADSIEPRYRFLVLLAGFTGPRQGELIGLTRRNVNPLHGRIRIVQARATLNDGSSSLGKTKSRAGVRTVTLPPQLREELVDHLATWSEPGRDGLVFTAPEGGPVNTRNFRDRAWRKAKEKAGISEAVHFHDLRHASATMAAATGATVPNLQRRLGHASSRAALIYQHATKSGDEEIAEEIGQMIEAARQRPKADLAEIWPEAPPEEAEDG